MASTVFPAAGGGVTKQQTDFTESGTWTAPAGVYSAEFLVVGAGGSGGGLLSSLVTQYTASGGGGGGGVKNINLTVTPGTSYTITIGAKGTGSTGVGANGGFSEVLDGASSLIKCYGGGGGWGLTGIVQVLPTLLNASAGMGGISNGGTTNTRFGGGGGGANPFIDPYGETNSEGSGVKNGGASYPDYGGRSIGNAGFNGYGAGVVAVLIVRPRKSILLLWAGLHSLEIHILEPRRGLMLETRRWQIQVAAAAEVSLG